MSEERTKQELSMLAEEVRGAKSEKERQEIRQTQIEMIRPEIIGKIITRKKKY